MSVSNPQASLIPGPPGLPVVGNLFQMRRATDIRLFINLFQEYGDVVHLQAGPRHLCLINHPDEVQHVLQSNNRNYVKGSTYAKLKPVLGEGLFTSEGEFWLRQRRLSASESSRVLLEVRTTSGRLAAVIVPSSGIVT